jgi:hypothetical protein
MGKIFSVAEGGRTPLKRHPLQKVEKGKIL